MAILDNPYVRSAAMMSVGVPGMIATLPALNAATGGKVGKAISNMDPTKVGRASTAAAEGVAGKSVQMAQDYKNKRVDRYNPQQVQNTFARASQVGNVPGMDNFQNTVGMAAGNVAQAGQIDPRVANYLQASQQSGQHSPQAIGMMQQAAMGGGPSAAQLQMQAGTDQAIKAQMAAAGSRGFSPAAMRGAQMQSAEMLQQSALGAANLRMQEQQVAQQAYLQAALQQEQMQRQAAMQAAGVTLDQSTQSQQLKQGAINAAMQGAGQFAGLGLEQATTNAQLAQQVGLANQDQTMRASLANAQLGLDAAQLQQQGQLGYGQLASGLMGAAGSVYGNIYNTEQGRQNQIAQTRSGLLGGLMSGGAAIGAAALSDRNAKKDIKTNKETQAFLNALTDNEYSYKNPSQAGAASGKQYGPMAQDLAKTKMGKTAVIDGPDGMMVDSSRGFLLALSGLANINQRLNKLGA